MPTLNNSRVNPQNQDLQDLAAGKAQQRSHSVAQSTEGVEVADNSFKDSAGANLANVSDQEFSEREAAKRALTQKLDN